jgi:uncharacterized protein YmfQ (DUF2313 family)
MAFVESRTKTEQTDVLAQYLRDDKLHLSKNIEGSNLRKVLIGLACEWLRTRDKIDEMYEEYDINSTTQYIEEWERVVGIPDDCINNAGSLEDRRQNILLKLAGVNVTTAKQFENLAALLGFTVTVETGVETSTFPMTLPFILLSEAEAPFVIVVTLDASLEPSGLPLTLPFTLSEQAPEILQCFFEKLKPANTTVIFRYS